MKDHITGHTLLQGTHHEGLYCFNAKPVSIHRSCSNPTHIKSSQPQVLRIVSTISLIFVFNNVGLWHRHHPALSVIKSIFRSSTCHMPNINKISFSEVILGKHHSLFSPSNIFDIIPLQLVVCAL